MNRTKRAVAFITLILLLLNFGLVYAQESYRTEISANYSHSRDQEDDESNVYSAQARLHFSPVNTSNHPLAEASFLERIGSVALYGGSIEGEGSFWESNGHFYGASVILRKPESQFAFSANYSKTKNDFDLQYFADQEQDADYYFFGIGYFFEPALFGEIQYSRTESETTFPGLSSKANSKSNFYKAFAKYVKEMPDGTAYNIEGTAGVVRFDSDWNDSGSNTIVSISGDYYFNREISIGACYSYNTGDDNDAEGNAFNVNLNAFLNQHFSVNAGFAKFVADDPEGEDAASFNVAVTTRF